MNRKTKFVLGIALLVQAVSFIALFFALYSRKRNLANTLITLAAAGSLAGGWLLLSSQAEDREHKKALTMDACCDFGGDEDLFEEFDEAVAQMPSRDE